MSKRFGLPVVCSFAALALLATASQAKTKVGYFALRVSPPEAYVFLDGTAIKDGGGLFWATPGEHTITLYNYGYKSESRKVNVEAGKKMKLSIRLEPVGGDVSGPWGRIQLEGWPRSVVLLNGKTPEFFVGHVDEFDHDIFWKQELLVPPGTHQIAVLRPGDNKELYSGSITVKANQRVIVDLKKNGEQRTTAWVRGESLKSLPRFKGGLASTTVAIGPVNGEFSATPADIKCGESSQLAWKTRGVVNAQIDGIGPVQESGQHAIQPKGTTTYKLTASGPGGVSVSSATVNVDNTVQASLNVTPAEVRYHRVGDKVEERGGATISWSASNADSVSLDPVGAVNASGSQTLQATPRKTDPGRVDESITYTLRASNACGGAETRTAMLHITGSIEALEAAVTHPKVTVTETTLETRLAMNSVYFPTGLPSKGKPGGGLLKSQGDVLAELASNFKKYLDFQPNAHLILQAHADKRGTVEFNKALSERRSARVKKFLGERGVPESNIETVAFGNVHNLDAQEVKKLEDENPNLSPEMRQKILRNLNTIVLVSNRRVDIVLSTTGQQSARYLPHNASDFEELMSEGRKVQRTPKAPKTPKKKK